MQQQVCGKEAEFAGEEGDLFMPACVVDGFAQNGFEFEEAAEAGDFVEMDADVVMEENLTAFVDDDADAQGVGEELPQSFRFGDREQLIIAGLGVGRIGPLVPDDLRGLPDDFAQFQSAVGDAKIRVSLLLDAKSRGREPFGDVPRRRRVTQAGFEFDVAGHGKLVRSLKSKTV